MKILLSSETLYPFTGGGDVAFKNILEDLHRRGHEVHALYIGESFDTKINLHPQNIKKPIGQWYSSVALIKKWKQILDSKIKEINPDWVMTRDLFIPVSIEVAKKNNVKVLTLIRNTYHLSINAFMPFGLGQFKYYIQYPFYRYLKSYTKRFLKESDIICESTNFMKRLTEKEYGVKTKVFMSLIKMDKNKIDTTNEYITMINPAKHKGYDIFRKAAKKCPNKKFLVVGKNINEPIENIKVLPWTNNMKEDVYSQTRALCVPSLWAEPLGNVIQEGMAFLLPSIVSNKGGLPEGAIPDLVVHNYNDVDEWVEKFILVHEKDYTSQLRELRKEFSYEVQIKRLLDILNK